MKKVFNWLGNVAGMIFAFAAYQILEYLYFFPRQLEKKVHIDSRILFFLIIVVTLLVLWFIFYLYCRQLQASNEWGFNNHPHWDLHRLIIMICGLIAIVLLSQVMIAFLGISAQHTSANQASLNKIAQHTGFSFVLLVCIIAPICEETIFRGLFFNTFFPYQSQLSKWLGIICSGFIFAYMHDPNITKFITIYWVLGCVLAWVYTTTKDLRYSILTHMLYNSMPYLLGIVAFLMK